MGQVRAGDSMVGRGVQHVLTVLWLCAFSLSSSAWAYPKDTDSDAHATGRGTAASCHGCHEDAWAAWRESRHAASFTNPLFQLSIEEVRQRDWCLSCHLPRPEQRALLREVGVRGAPGTILADGVDCHTCHVEDGRVISGGIPDALAWSAHRVEMDAELGTSAFCARCHQFQGPKEHPPFLLAGDALQNTYREWLDAGVDKRCQDCHMPNGEHRFQGAHTVSMLRRAVAVDVSRGEETLTLTLTATDAVAHKVPTGDPFRRLRIALCVDEACQQRVWTRFLGVAHEHRDGVLRVVRDTRLSPGVPWTVEITPPPDARFWQVAMMYGEVQWSSRLPEEEQLGVVYQGAL